MSKKRIAQSTINEETISRALRLFKELRVDDEPIFISPSLYDLAAQYNLDLTDFSKRRRKRKVRIEYKRKNMEVER